MAGYGADPSKNHENTGGEAAGTRVTGNALENAAVQANEEDAEAMRRTACANWSAEPEPQHATSMPAVDASSARWYSADSSYGPDVPTHGSFASSLREGVVATAGQVVSCNDPVPSPPACKLLDLRAIARIFTTLQRDPSARQPQE